MKIFVYLLMGLFLIHVGFGCRYKSKENAESSAAQRKPESSSLRKGQVATTPAEKYCELEVDSVLPASLDHIPLKIINHTEGRMETGDEYRLEYYNDTLSTWQNALPPNIVFTLLLHIIPPHDTVDFTVYEYTGKPGKYRVIKEVTILYDFNDRSYNYLVIGEFVLSDQIDKEVKEGELSSSRKRR